MSNLGSVFTGSISDRCATLSAKGYVDKKAIERWGVDLATLRKMGDAFHSGWLHNVLSRITPLTMRRREDYLAMTDIFIESAEDAERLLDRFESDLELFCSQANITITEHMTAQSVSTELETHVDLFEEINSVLHNKFGIEMRDPILNLAVSPILSETNPFVKDFIDEKFERA